MSEKRKKSNNIREKEIKKDKYNKENFSRNAKDFPYKKKELNNKKSINSSVNLNKSKNNMRNIKGNVARKIKFTTRISIVLVFVAILFIALIGKLTYIVVFEGDELTKKATDQQVISKTINPERGSILDRNGEILAQSVPVDSISLNPEELLKKKNKDGNKIDIEKFVVNTASILEIDIVKLRKDLEEKKNVIIAKYVNVDKVKKYKQYLEDNDLTYLVAFNQDYKRVYPYGSLASQLIGFCGVDNTGLEGLERSYNDILSGRPGKITTIGDGSKNFTSEFPSKVIKEENGKNIYLSIDIKLQNSVEKHLKDTVEEYKADSGVVIGMNPKNGQILAMSSYPNYDLNKPFTPTNLKNENWDSLDIKTKNDRLQAIWKNRAVSDPYEPGSVFKLVTAAIGLEQGVAKADTKGDFYCSGYQQVEDRKISCWHKQGHGAESLHDAIKNSCNPSMIQLGQRIGKNDFVKYMDAFGFFNLTGADISGESLGQFFRSDSFNSVELATLSFGQRFTVNPLQMINAVSAIVNGGQLYKPTIIYKVKNESKGTVEFVEPELVRKVISQKHSKEIRDMMRDVIETGTGRRGKVEGYSVGGKTGTSEPAPNDKSAGYVASFVGAAPIEEPEIVVLAIIKNPKEKSHEGSVVAAPLVANILKDVLPGMKKTNVLDLKETSITKNEDLKTIKVPNVEGKTVFEARQILQKEGLVGKSPLVSNMNEIKIEKQIPQAGTEINTNGTVYLKIKEQKLETTKMPKLTGQKVDAAIELLRDIGLNYILDKPKGIVTNQNIPEGTELEKGRVVVLKID